MKKIAYAALLSCASLFTFSCLESSNEESSEIVTKNISIPFMAHSGSTHLECGLQMINLGTTNESGYMQDLRFYVHDVTLIDQNGDTYPLTLTSNDWQTANVTLLSFMNKAAADCPSAINSDIETNTHVIGKYTAPGNANISGINFKVGVPFELNHQNPASAQSPLNVLAMSWNWQTGYKHMRIEADVDGNNFVFHLGSVGCDGNPTIGGTTACARSNRPEVELNDFDPKVNAVRIDIQSLVENLNLSSGGTCHSQAASTICQNTFDALGLDYYDGTSSSDNILFQANAGQTVFSTAMDHE